MHAASRCLECPGSHFNRFISSEPLLSFAYTLLAQEAASAIAAAGLDPAIGFLHQPLAGRPTVARSRPDGGVPADRRRLADAEHSEPPNPVGRQLLPGRRKGRRENARLRRLLAEKELDLDMLQEVARGTANCSHWPQTESNHISARRRALNRVRRHQ